MCGCNATGACLRIISDDQLINTPALLDGQPPPCVISDDWIKKGLPEFSIILTVFNQDRIVGDVLERLLKLTTESWELVVVFDGCTDTSMEVVQNTVHANCKPGACRNHHLLHVLQIRHPVSVFETAANNIGMRAALGQFWVLVQDDMFINEAGWNSHLAVPARIYPDVLAVSARCAHSFGLLLDPPTRLNSSVGRCGRDVEQPFPSAGNTCTFHVRDTSNRGPLLLVGRLMVSLGLFDEVNIMLYNDDHDLMARAWQQGLVAGYMPVDFHSPLQYGGTRRQVAPSISELAYLAKRKRRMSPSFLSKILSNASLHNHFSTHDDDRVFPQYVGCMPGKMWWLGRGH